MQVGAVGDIAFPGCLKYLGCDLNTLHNLMVNANGFVGMDGMLGVFAAHVKTRQYIIYTGGFKMEWTAFPNRIQINGNRMSNQEISDLILGDLCAT